MIKENDQQYFTSSSWKYLRLYFQEIHQAVRKEKKVMCGSSIVFGEFSMIIDFLICKKEKNT